MRAILFALILMIAPPAHADVAGVADPGFVAARELWLSGADLEGLAALSAPAQEGNAAAQALLGRIEREDYLHRHVTGDLSRAERIALMRAPGGLSGTSWLTVAAEADPVAAVIAEGAGQRSAERLESLVAMMARLLEAGEKRLALSLLQTMVNQGDSEFVAAFGTHPALDGMGGGLVVFLRRHVEEYRDAWSDADERMRQLDLVLAAANVPPTARDLWWLPEPAPVLGESLIRRIAALARQQGIAEFAPWRALCAEACGESVETCLLGLRAVNPTLALYALSPAESVLPSALYQSSARITGDLRALIALPADTAEAGRGWVMSQVRPIDGCAATLVLPP